MKLYRHNLLFISEKERQKAAENAVDPDISRLILDKKVPAITKRQEKAEAGRVEVGFSSWLYREERRLRAAESISQKEVVKVLSPYEVFEKVEVLTQSDIMALLEELGAKAECMGFLPGVFGSTALEAVTGYPYLNEKSDVDVILRMKEGGLDVRGMAQYIKKLEQKYGRQVDAEMYLPGGYGIKIKEVYNNQKTVLAKGLNDARIIQKKDLCFYKEAGVLL